MILVYFKTRKTSLEVYENVSSYNVFIIGGLAQLAEHRAYDAGVTSSNLVFSTKFKLVSSNLENIYF